MGKHELELFTKFKDENYYRRTPIHEYGNLDEEIFSPPRDRIGKRKDISPISSDNNKKLKDTPMDDFEIDEATYFSPFMTNTEDITEISSIKATSASAPSVTGVTASTPSVTETIASTPTVTEVTTASAPSVTEVTETSVLGL